MGRPLAALLAFRETRPRPFPSRILEAEPGLYVLSGQAATFRVLTHTTMTADQGSYALSGQAASLLHHRRMVAEQGSYLLTGQDANLATAWYGLADFGLGTSTNDATTNRHYVIDDAPALDLNASTGWAWFVFTNLSQNAGSLHQYWLSSGALNANPSFNAWIREASAPTLQNTYSAGIGDASSDFSFEGATGLVDLNQVRLIVIQYDGADLQLYICDPGESAVLAASTSGPVGNIVAPGDWFFGRRSDGQTGRYFQERMGGLGKVDRALTTGEIAQLATGISPITLLGADCAGAWAFKNGAQAVEPDLTANGNDATRQGTWGPSLTAEQGSYILTGQASSLLWHRRLVAAQGAYALTGQDAELFRAILLEAAQGGYTLTGQPATLLWHHRMTAAQGSYTLSGQAAELTYNPVASDPPDINGSESLIAFTNFQNPRVIDTSGQTWTSGDYVLALFASTSSGGNSGLASAANGGTDDTSTSIIGDDTDDAALASFEVTVNGGALDSSFSFPTPAARRNGGGLITLSGAAANASQPNVSEQTSGTSNDPTAPSVTTTVNNCRVIGAISVRGAQDLTTLLGALPAGWTFLFSGRTSASTTLTAAHCTFAVCHKVQATAGATGDAVWTDGVDIASIAGWNGQQIAIAPA